MLRGDTMNKEKMIEMLEYSSLAYKKIQPQLDDKTLYIIDDKKTDIQCYIRIYNDELDITFRGTNSNKDRITDLKFWKKVIPYGNYSSKIRVHSGFIDAYKCKNVRDRIHKYVTPEIKKVNVMGHSYGAALAVLCAVDLEYNFPLNDYEVFLFGCPRIGNRAFKESYNKRVFKTFRVDNSNDIVTKIPFALLGYRHVGIKIHIGIPRLYGIFSFNDHRPQKYYTNLFKIMA